MVEHDLAKVGVAGPSPVSRSKVERLSRQEQPLFTKYLTLSTKRRSSVCPDGRADRLEMLW